MVQSPNLDPVLSWLKSQSQEMLELAKQWSAINSYSYHLEGLESQRRALKEVFGTLGELTEVVLPPFKKVDPDTGILKEQPLGKALSIRKRPEAKFQILFSGHMDTVFGPEHPFQDVSLLQNGCIINHRLWI